MDVQFQTPQGKGWDAECTLVFAHSGMETGTICPSLWDAAPWLGITPGTRDFSGKAETPFIVYGHPDIPLSRVMLVGLGPKDKLTANVFRKAVAQAFVLCREKGFARIGICLQNIGIIAPELDMSRDALAGEAVVAAHLGLYRCEGYKGTAKKSLASVEENAPTGPQKIVLFLTEKFVTDELQKTIRLAEAEGAGVLLARDLVNGPANYIRPAALADKAQALARKHGFSCTVFDEEQARGMGMGAFASVAQGAKEEARFIVLEHCPKGMEEAAPFVAVGKGITFDTGGISLKPSAKMHEMKGDMAGAAAVVGLFAAMGEAFLAGIDQTTFGRVVGIIPATENMPGGQAVRPGDVVTTLSGQTVEILNTDAEGRLVLCDALTYAQNNWQPRALVDIATLTGACVVALGDYASGLFTKQTQLRQTILDEAERLGSLYWPLPLWDAYESGLKSDVADFANIGPREGGALYAALFLQRFVDGETPWAHLDIAGPGYVVKTDSLHPVAGGTGEGVRLLCALARRV